MFRWLFNMCKYGVVRKVKTRMMKKEGALRRSWEDRGWKVNQLLFVDGTVLAVDSTEKLRSLVKEFERVYGVGS